MIFVVQRVLDAAVSVAGETVGAIGPGLLVFVCGMPDDDDETVSFLTRKLVNLRIFEDDTGKMNRSVLETGGAVLVVSQFTLAAQWRKGNRPSFSEAAPPAEAERLYEEVKKTITEHGVPVACGRFGADMQVALINDGPVTLILDSST
ncbi:MAG: D-aminoacyl-tRNA deacylase [Magnetospiraceae bacterium]